VNPMQPRSLRAPSFFAMVLGLAACASGSGGSGGGGSADTITQQQIDEADFASALEVVRRYRPRWLQPTRSPTSSGVRPLTGRPGMPQSGGDAVVDETYARVVLDGVPYGEIASLSSISPRTVAAIHFVSASDARRRYGAGYDGGVIEVRSR
jgi:hypothetical protein